MIIAALGVGRYNIGGYSYIQGFRSWFRLAPGVGSPLAVHGDLHQVQELRHNGAYKFAEHVVDPSRAIPHEHSTAQSRSRFAQK